MNTTMKKYMKPEIDLIQLDCLISLALESAPPQGPEEGMSNNNFKNPGVTTVIS